MADPHMTNFEKLYWLMGEGRKHRFDIYEHVLTFDPEAADAGDAHNALWEKANSNEYLFRWGFKKEIVLLKEDAASYDECHYWKERKSYYDCVNGKKTSELLGWSEVTKRSAIAAVKEAQRWPSDQKVESGINSVLDIKHNPKEDVFFRQHRTDKYSNLFAETFKAENWESFLGLSSYDEPCILPDYKKRCDWHRSTGIEGLVHHYLSTDSKYPSPFCLVGCLQDKIMQHGEKVQGEERDYYYCPLSIVFKTPKAGKLRLFGVYYELYNGVCHMREHYEKTQESKEIIV